jgi:hypothetical protein
MPSWLKLLDGLCVDAGRGGVHENNAAIGGVMPCGACWGGVGPGQGNAGKTDGEPGKSAEHLELVRLCAGERHPAEVGGEDAGGKLQF